MSRRRKKRKKSRGRSAVGRRPSDNPGSSATTSPNVGGTIQQRVIQMEERRGPLPDPQTLREYDKVVPGAAERIIQMAEKEVDHRRDIQRRALDAQIDDNKVARIQTRRGQFLGAGVVVLFGGATIYALITKQGDAAKWLGVLVTVPLTIVFVTGRIMTFFEKRKE